MGMGAYSLGVCFFALIIWHIYLHFGWKVWFRKFRKQKSPVTRWLALFGLLTVVSAAVVMVHWAVSFAHSPIGGVHGKSDLSSSYLQSATP